MGIVIPNSVNRRASSATKGWPPCLLHDKGDPGDLSAPQIGRLQARNRHRPLPQLGSDSVTGSREASVPVTRPGSNNFSIVSVPAPVTASSGKPIRTSSTSSSPSTAAKLQRSVGDPVYASLFRGCLPVQSAGGRSRGIQSQSVILNADAAVLSMRRSPRRGDFGTFSGWSSLLGHTWGTDAVASTRSCQGRGEE